MYARARAGLTGLAGHKALINMDVGESKGALCSLSAQRANDGERVDSAIHELLGARMYTPPLVLACVTPCDHTVSMKPF